MKITLRLLVVTLACDWHLAAQAGPPLVGSSYTYATLFNIAPGQLVTLVVEGLSDSFSKAVRAPGGADLPTSLAGIDVVHWQGTGRYAPVLEVIPYDGCTVPNAQGICTRLAAITVQIPFEAQCDLCARNGGIASGILRVDEDGTPGPSVFVFGTFPDQVHILTACDTFLVPFQGMGVPINSTGLPCPSVVTHADGSLVSAKNPAKAGEEVVAYTVGLGQTTPALATGKLVTAAVPTQTTFKLHFNYTPNALATKPLPTAPLPVYAGATPGYVGLYQVNFVVPPAPAETPACVDPGPSYPPGLNIVQSNLTVSVGGVYSFDGARICVAVPSP